MTQKDENYLLQEICRNSGMGVAAINQVLKDVYMSLIHISVSAVCTGFCDYLWTAAGNFFGCLRSCGISVPADVSKDRI